MHLLRENGGIVVNKKVLLLEGLDWLNNLESNLLLNRGSKAVPEVFGFFSPGYSSSNQILQGDRHLVQFPSLDTNFLAAVKDSIFVSDLLK